MKRAFALALVATLGAIQAAAETDFKALSEGERLLLGAEIRAVLLAHPEIVGAAINPTFEPYADDIARDIALINRHREALFGDADLAIFVTPDCEACKTAQEELSVLAKANGLSVNTLNVHQAEELATDLQIDVVPFYVLPDKMLRGAMPSIVLERFLTDIAD